MSRYIDADALKNDINAQVAILNAMSVSTGIDELRQIGEELQRGMVAEIDKQPTVNAVPVVRCWECRRWSKDEPDDEYGYCYNGKIIGSTKENWYCADGERRTDD